MDELSLETRSVDPIIALLHPIQDAELSKCRGDAPVSMWLRLLAGLQASKHAACPYA